MTDSSLQGKGKFRGLGGVGGTEPSFAREMKRLRRCSIREATKSGSEQRPTEPQKARELLLGFAWGLAAGRASR